MVSFIYGLLKLWLSRHNKAGQKVINTTTNY